MHKMHVKCNGGTEEVGSSAQPTTPSRLSRRCAACETQPAASRQFVTPLWFVFAVYALFFAVECDSVSSLAVTDGNTVFEDESFISYSDEDASVQASYDGEDEIFSLAYANREAGIGAVADTKPKVPAQPSDTPKVDPPYTGGGAAHGHGATRVYSSTSPGSTSASSILPEPEMLPATTDTFAGVSPAPHDSTSASRASFHIGTMEATAAGTTAMPPPVPHDSTAASRHANILLPPYSVPAEKPSYPQPYAAVVVGSPTPNITRGDVIRPRPLPTGEPSAVVVQPPKPFGVTATGLTPKGAGRRLVMPIRTSKVVRGPRRRPPHSLVRLHKRWSATLWSTGARMARTVDAQRHVSRATQVLALVALVSVLLAVYAIRQNNYFATHPLDDPNDSAASGET